MKHLQKKLQYGMTLIELSVVLLVLVALAGLAIPYVSGTGQTAMCQATDATMQAVKEAIMGGAAGNGYYADTLGAYPADKGDSDYNLKYLFVAGDGNGSDTVPDWPTFNPQTGVGWRGPYLMSGATLTGEQADALSGTFKDSSDVTPHVHAGISGNDNVVLDAWGRPIIIQVPTLAESCPSNPANPADCARLVSAGPGRGVGINEADIDTAIGVSRSFDGYASNDDRILYLKIPSPASDQNTPCNDT